MLRIDNLTKRYGDHRVFQGLTHTFAPGCFALCEEASTGKSSLLRIIAGVIEPDEGDVWIDGQSLLHAPQPARSRVAYVPENCLASPLLTGRAFLEQAAAAKSTTVTDVVLAIARQLDLEAHLDKRFEQMSTGARRKVYLTAAALADPAVVIADGPSDGLDARSCAVLADLFRTWSQDRVVLFASHDPAFVQASGARCVAVDALR